MLHQCRTVPCVDYRQVGTGGTCVGRGLVSSTGEWVGFFSWGGRKYYKIINHRSQFSGEVSDGQHKEDKRHFEHAFEHSVT